MEDVMNRLSKQCIVAVLAIIGFIRLLGITGTYEYADQIVYTMPEEVYYRVPDTLGNDCSNRAVAAEYMSKKEYYDNLQY